MIPLLTHLGFRQAVPLKGQGLYLTVVPFKNGRYVWIGYTFGANVKFFKILASVFICP